MGARAERMRARILAAIADKSMTTKELAGILYVGRDWLGVYVAELVAEKAIYIDSYQFNPKGGRPSPRWKAGKMPSAAYTKTRPVHGDVPAMTREAIKKLLRGRMLSAPEIAKRLNLHPGNVRRKLLELRKGKEVRIAEWGYAASGGILPLYSLGSEPDAVRNLVDQRIRQRAYRERNKTRLNDNQRWRARLRKKPNSWLSALGL